LLVLLNGITQKATIAKRRYFLILEWFFDDEFGFDGSLTRTTSDGVVATVLATWQTIGEGIIVRLREWPYC
jgi:hypothetical protein